MAARELQGWHPDPFGLHEMRYFSVGRPTKLVRDGRVDGYDEPPADWSKAAAESTAVDGQPLAVARPELPAGALAGAPMPATAVGSPAMPVPAAPGQWDPASPTRVFHAVQTTQVALPVVPGPAARPPRRRMEYAFVAAGAVVAVVVFVVLGGGTAKPGIAPAAFVTKAAKQTLSRQTADYTLSATAHVAGSTVAMGGSGQIDLTNGSMSFAVGATTASGSIAENELQVGGNRYLKVTVNGRSLALSGGRHWIEMPFSATVPQNFAAASPASSLALLSEQGANVTSLGTRSIGGQSCNGYTVTPSSQAMMTVARQEYAAIGMPAAETATALQALQKVPPPTITAWFGTTSSLACEVTLDMQFGAPTSSGSGDVAAKLTFTHYGAPIKITAPPASDTVSVQQFLRAITHH